MATTDTDRVLIAYDGSVSARSAIERAARLFPGRLALVITVWASAREMAGAARAALLEAVLDEAVRSLDTAHEQQALAVGSRGRSGLRSALLGSVSNAVVHHCRRPVIVVHPDAEESPAG